MDNGIRLALLRLLLETNEYPCVSEIADAMSRKVSVGLSAVCQYLKILREAGLVTCKRENKRIYYRAFPSTENGKQTIIAFATFFRSRPPSDRIAKLLIFIHALSHHRRHVLIRYLSKHPGTDIEKLAKETEMPPATVSRLLMQLDKAKIVDLARNVVLPPNEPEASLIRLTLAD